MSSLSNARAQLDAWEAKKPESYTSQYKDKIDGVMGKLDGMKDFSYDPTRDAAYEQYKNSYTRQAKLANEYTQKKSDLQNQLSGYQQAEAQDYEKYQTNYQNWENQRNYYQSAYNQAASESQAKKSRSTGIFGTILSVAASLLPFLL